MTTQMTIVELYKFEAFFCGRFFYFALSEEVDIETSRDRERPRKIQKKLMHTTTVHAKCLNGISKICVNSTLGQKGICLNSLVFVVKPELLLFGSLLAAVPDAQLLMMMDTARDEHIKLFGTRTDNSRKALILSTLRLSLEFGNKALVFRETVGK